jgi:phosphatidylglycerophosphate synthase
MNKTTLKDIKDAEEEKSNWSINIYPLSYLSHYIAFFFVKFLPFITPNQISFLWGFISLVGIFLIGLGGYFNMVIGILIYHFAILLDYVDGQVARATKNTTLGGTYLDMVFSWINRSLLVFALGVGIYRMNGEIIFFYIGLWTGFLFMIDNLAKLKVYESLIGEDRLDLIQKQKEEIKKLGERKSKKSFLKNMLNFMAEMLRPFSPFSFLFFSIIFNIPQIYLILVSIIVPIFFIKNFVGIYNNIGNIPTKKYEFNESMKRKLIEELGGEY